MVEGLNSHFNKPFIHSTILQIMNSISDCGFAGYFFSGCGGETD
jgi:hypothetical protein